MFLIKPNNLELILRHPPSPLKNTVPRKSTVALLSSIWSRIRNRARSYFLEYIILTRANKITTHFSCSCRNEGQRLDAFQIYYLCDALNCNKAMSENNTFWNIKLNYFSFKIFPRFWLPLISCSCRNEGQRLDAFEGGLPFFAPLVGHLGGKISKQFGFFYLAWVLNWLISGYAFKVIKIQLRT